MAANPSRDFIPVEARQTDVDQREIGAMKAGSLDGSGTVGGNPDLMARGFQQRLEHLATVGIVLNHQDVRTFWRDLRDRGTFHDGRLRDMGSYW